MRAVAIIRVQQPDIDFIEERAVADFRAFEATASLHVKRVRTPDAIDAMMKVLESLKKDLQRKTLVLS